MLKKVLKILKVCLFIGIFVWLVVSVYDVLRYKNHMGVEQVETFYALPEESVDVLVVGNSHVYMNVDTGAMWDEQGIAVYDLSTSGQPLWNTYHLIVEALKTQKPDVIVVEVSGALIEKEYETDLSIGSALFGMNISKNFLEAVKASSQEEKRLEYVLKYPFYHLRYTSLEKDDFVGNAKSTYMGYLPLFQTTEYESLPRIEKQQHTTSSANKFDESLLTDKNVEYIKKIIQLSMEEEIPILFVAAPFYGYNSKAKEIFEQVGLLGDENNNGFVNFNEKMHFMGLDAKKDFAEASHLNWRGAEKYSRCLAKCLVDYYDISDRRGNENYIMWQENADLLRREKDNYMLAQEQNIIKYFEKIKKLDSDYEVIVTVSKKPDIEWVQKVLPCYSGEEGIWIKGQHEFALHSRLNWHMMFEYDDLNVCYDQTKKLYRFYYNESEETRTTIGINVYVFDRKMNDLVDSVGFFEDNVYR